MQGTTSTAVSAETLYAMKLYLPILPSTGYVKSATVSTLCRINPMYTPATTFISSHVVNTHVTSHGAVLQIASPTSFKFSGTCSSDPPPASFSSPPPAAPRRARSATFQPARGASWCQKLLSVSSPHFQKYCATFLPVGIKSWHTTSECTACVPTQRGPGVTESVVC